MKKHLGRKIAQAYDPYSKAYQTLPAFLKEKQP